MQDPLGLTPEQRRAAEERFAASCSTYFAATMEIPLERRSGSRAYQPAWPLPDGRIRCTEASEGIFVEETRIEREYPDTIVVIVFRCLQRPECRFAAAFGLWLLNDLLEPEPRSADTFLGNFHEWLATDFRPRRYACRPDETIVVGDPGSWSTTLPRLASGGVDLSREHRELAVRALEALQRSGVIPTDA